MAILALLHHESQYGLHILHKLHQFDSLQITDGTLYTLLDRLKREGVINSFWQQEDEERPRNYYKLSALGINKPHALTARWQQSVDNIYALFEQSDLYSEPTWHCTGTIYSCGAALLLVSLLKLMLPSGFGVRVAEHGNSVVIAFSQLELNASEISRLWLIPVTFLCDAGLLYLTRQIAHLLKMHLETSVLRSL